jgi:hypothetical protein
MTALAEHASGCLAPLTASIELGWDAPLLEGGVTLVDLPGLGIANDLHPSVTRALAGSFDMILLVVDRSGVSEASARLLMQVFCDLSSSEDVSQRPEPSLVVAVTKLDQVADASVSGCRSTSAWRDACASAAARARELVRSQLESEVNRRKGAAGELMRRVVCRVQVVPVFPLEYQRIHRGDPEEPPKLDLSATGIARLAVAIRDPELSSER